MEKEVFMDCFFLFMKEEVYKFFIVQEFEEMLNIMEVEEFKELVKVLVVFEEMGQIVCIRSNCYGFLEKMNLVKGKIFVYVKGFVFLLLEDILLSDVFILLNELNMVMNGDIVMVWFNFQLSGLRQEGIVI